MSDIRIGATVSVATDTVANVVTNSYTRISGMLLFFRLASFVVDGLSVVITVW